ncbi:MAG: hypothetical protein ABRQ38_24590, partial [Candidatus Eremiobacterota bacterium]
QYDPESVKNIVSSTVGLEQGRDKITIVNRNFKNMAEAGVSNISPPAPVVAAESSPHGAQHGHTKFFGIVSLILASIFLVLSVRIIAGK